MAKVYPNRAKVTASTSGLADFTLGAAYGGFRTFADAGVSNGDTFTYLAYLSLTEWEIGEGTYSSTGPTLARTTVYASTNAGAKVNFTSAPLVGPVVAGEDIAALAPLVSPGFTTPDIGAATGDSLSLGGAATPQAQLHVGDRDTVVSSDPAILAARTVNTAGNSHGISDASLFESNTYAYAAFDARTRLGGTAGNTYDHFVGFQSLPRITSNVSLGEHHGLYSSIELLDGHIDNCWLVSLDDPYDVGGGSGTIDSLIGIRIPALTKGSVENYAVYTEGTTPSYFGGAITTNGSLTVEKSSGTARITLKGNAGQFFDNVNYRSTGLGPLYSMSRARGTIASPSNVLVNDGLGYLDFWGYADGALRNGANVRVKTIAATPSSTDIQTQFAVDLAPAGSVAPAEILALDHTNGLILTGSAGFNQTLVHTLSTNEAALIFKQGANNRAKIAETNGGDLSIYSYPNAGAWMTFLSSTNNIRFDRPAFSKAASGDTWFDVDSASSTDYQGFRWVNGATALIYARYKQSTFDWELYSSANAVAFIKFSNSSNRLDFGSGTALALKTVAELPAASGKDRCRFEVSDASSPVVGSAVAGGGSTKAEVRSNASIWEVIHIFS